MDYRDLANYFVDALGIANVGIGKVLSVAHPRQNVWVEVRNLRGQPTRVQAIAGNVCITGHSCGVFRDKRGQYYAFDSNQSYSVMMQDAQFRRIRQKAYPAGQSFYAPILTEMVSFFAPTLWEKADLFAPALIEIDKKKERLLAVLYQILVEDDPVPCECQKSYDRDGNVVTERCDGGGQYSSADDALNASEPPFPDPTKRYLILYASAGLKAFLGYSQSTCDVSWQKSNCFITGGTTHPAWDDVLTWASFYDLLVYPGDSQIGPYIQGNIPLYPISGVTPNTEFSLVIGGFYGGARHVSANGWMGMNFTIFKIQNGVVVSQFGLCWSYFKMALAGESPSSPEYDSGAFNPSGFPLNNGSPIELVYSGANAVCTPYGNGNPNQGEPPIIRQRTKASKHLYLAGSRVPTLIKKINAEELVKSYVVKTGISSEAVGLTVGNSTAFCKTIFTVLNGSSITTSIVNTPTKPSAIPSDWKGQYVDYSPPYSFDSVSGNPNYNVPPDTGNIYTDPSKSATDINIQTVSGNAPNSSSEIIFRMQQIGLVKQENQAAAIEFSVAFQGNIQFSTSICVVKLNPFADERKVKIEGIIPANASNVSILGKSAFFDRSLMESIYQSGSVGCALQPIYQGDVVEAYSSGYDYTYIPRETYQYSYANGDNPLILRNCNDVVIAEITPLYGGGLTIQNQTIIGYCE